MSTFDNYLANPTSVPPLTRAVIAAMPTTTPGNPASVVGPCVTNASLRSLLDALAGLETRLTTLGG